MPSKNLATLKKLLGKAAQEKNEGMRQARIASIVSGALKTIGIDPILVGGAAVSFYTDATYTTKDIDMIAPSGKDVEAVMFEIGFTKFGKDYINKELGIYIEFPSEALGPTERFNLLDIDGRQLRIISIEDLIIDRLSAYKFWKSGIDGVNALRLIELGQGDRQRVEKRAREEDVLDALDYLENILSKGIRKKIPSAATSELIEKFIRRK